MKMALGARFRVTVKTLQPVMAALISLGLVFQACGQDESAKKLAPESSAAHAGSPLPIPLKLHYDDPKTFPVGTRQSLILSDFKCGADGSVFLPMMSDDVSKVALQGEGPQEIGPLMMVVALTPAGGVVRFTPQQISGYRNVMLTLRYFVSRSHVYLLEMADKLDQADLQATTGRSRFIQVFDYKGQPTQLIVLPPDINPVNVAAFASGEILLFSVDELNHTTRLLLLDESGRTESELRLFDNDFGLRLEGGAKGRNSLSSWQNDDALSRSIALANLIPRGENLLLALSQFNLPVLDLINTAWFVLPYWPYLQIAVFKPCCLRMMGSLSRSSASFIYRTLHPHRRTPIPPHRPKVSPASRGFFLPLRSIRFTPRMVLCSVESRYRRVPCLCARSMVSTRFSPLAVRMADSR